MQIVKYLCNLTNKPLRTVLPPLLLLLNPHLFFKNSGAGAPAPAPDGAGAAGELMVYGGGSEDEVDNVGGDGGELPKPGNEFIIRMISHV